MARGPASCHWPRMVFNGLQPRILQNIFRVTPGIPRFPHGFQYVSQEKRSTGLRCRTPHACIHLEKFMQPLALVSGAPPTKHTCSGSIPLPIIHFQHLALMHASFWGVTPLVPIHFWQKVRGLTPPLIFIHYRKCRIHPPYSWTSWGRGFTTIKYCKLQCKKVIFDSITKYTIVENTHPPQGGVPPFLLLLL